MKTTRGCSRPGCTRTATATLTYDYAGSTAVLGPLAIGPEPHSYDLCDAHAERLTAPRGWDVIRLSSPGGLAPEPTPDDIEALADAVREAARDDRPDPAAPRWGPGGVPRGGPPQPPPGAGRRAHLRVLSSDS